MGDADLITRVEFRAVHQALQNDILRLDRQMNGNGQPGIRQDIEVILMHQSQVKAVLEDRTAAENRHYTRITIMLAVLSLLLAAVGILVGVRMEKQGELRRPEIHSSVTTGPEYAVDKQPALDATVEPH
jgi:hypothetical protein